jgi:hypothetical protein
VRTFRASEETDPEDYVHAVVVDVTLEAEPTPESLAVLQNEVVAGVKASPGCIAGYWLEPVDGKGHSIVLFDTEEQARAAAPPLGAAPMPGVTIDRVDIRAVIATA